MRVLLDTHVLLWALAQPHRLDQETRATIESGAADVLFSAASIWEIAIKAGLGRGDFRVKPAEIARAAVDTGFIELAVRSNAAALVAELPLFHRDPFDRVLVAQAIAEPATLYTADERLAPYSELVRCIAAQSSRSTTPPRQAEHIVLVSDKRFPLRRDKSMRNYAQLATARRTTTPGYCRDPWIVVVRTPQHL